MNITDGTALKNHHIGNFVTAVNGESNEFSVENFAKLKQIYLVYTASKYQYYLAKNRERKASWAKECIKITQCTL